MDNWACYFSLIGARYTIKNGFKSLSRYLVSEYIMTRLLLARSNPSQSSDDVETEQIEAAKKDPAAFAVIYQAYVQPVYRYIYNHLGNRQDAEDVTAQVFLEALEGIGSYRHIGPFAAWLYTIAHHRTIDLLRRRLSIPLPEDDALNVALSSVNPDIVKDDLQDLKNQVSRLTEAEQELLRLRFAAGLSFREIGAISSKSEAAVKMSLYRLLRKLESILE